jgi:hypothetical protein
MHQSEREASGQSKLFEFVIDRSREGFLQRDEESKCAPFLYDFTETFGPNLAGWAAEYWTIFKKAEVTNHAAAGQLLFNPGGAKIYLDLRVEDIRQCRIDEIPPSSLCINKAAPGSYYGCVPVLLYVAGFHGCAAFSEEFYPFVMFLLRAGLVHS